VPSAGERPLWMCPYTQLIHKSGSLMSQLLSYLSLLVVGTRSFMVLAEMIVTEAN